MSTVSFWNVIPDLVSYPIGTDSSLRLSQSRNGHNLLSWLMDIDGLTLHFNLVARGQKCVEANNQVRVTFEEVRHSVNDTRGVYAVRIREAKDIKELQDQLTIHHQFGKSKG